MKRGKGRPARETLDRITDDAAIRWLVERERQRSGVSVKVAQGMVANAEQLTDRHVREAYERFGRLKSVTEK